MIVFENETKNDRLQKRLTTLAISYQVLKTYNVLLYSFDIYKLYENQRQIVSLRVQCLTYCITPQLKNHMKP